MSKKRKKSPSQYDLYPMPFFDKAKHSCWSVVPTGDYVKDCDTGKEYAELFLRYCDGTVGWGATFSQIVQDMIRQGPQGRVCSDGHHLSGGVVVGFLGTIGRALCVNQAGGSKRHDWGAIRTRVADICEALEISPTERAEIDAALKEGSKTDDAQPIVDFCRRYGQNMDYVSMGILYPLFRGLRYHHGMSRDQLAAERRQKHLRVV